MKHKTSLLFKSGMLSLGLSSFFSCSVKNKNKTPTPNVLVILADQWRYDAFGYRNNPDVKTPNIDRLASEGIVLSNAISGIPVSTPARASILTGQRPLTNGIFMNDVQLDTNALSIAEVIKEKGYKTAYIGKWHLDGQERSAFIPQDGRRQGFDYWKVLECTHSYNNSLYYADTPDTLVWDGYDAFAQTRDASQYIRNNAKTEDPFLLFLSWGPPHDPYHTAPEEYRAMYFPDSISLRPNVPDDHEKRARNQIAGYYSHCTALDEMVGELWKTVIESGIGQETIILFFSDHGDMLGSQGAYNKQQPYDESIRIPMIFYIPEKLGGKSAKLDALINLEDIMPTILGLCAADIPSEVEGLDYSSYLKGGENPGDTLTVITSVMPYGQWNRGRGGREFRGLRSLRYTYVKDLNGPWLFFDNEKDPYQMDNLVGKSEYSDLINSFDLLLSRKLESQGDEFLPGLYYVEKWNYPELDETGTVPFIW